MAHVTQLRFNLGSHLALELEFRRVYVACVALYEWWLRHSIILEHGWPSCGCCLNCKWTVGNRHWAKPTGPRAKPFYFLAAPQQLDEQAGGQCHTGCNVEVAGTNTRTRADNLTSLSTGWENGNCEQGGKLRSLSRCIWQCRESEDMGWTDEWEPVARINRAEAGAAAEGMLGPEQRIKRALTWIVTNEAD